MVQRSHQLRELRTALDLHEPERALAHFHHLALGGAPRLLDQRWDLGRLEAPVHHLERCLPGDLASDRVHRPERRLVLLVVDAEFRACLLRDDGQRREDAFLRVVVEALEREGRHARRAVDVGRVLPLDGLDDEVVRARLDAVADDVRDRRLDKGCTFRDEFGLDPVQHQHGRGVAIEGSLGAQCLLDLRTLFGHAGAPLLDLIAALAIGEAPVIEDLAPLAQVLVPLGDHRLAAFHRREPLLDLFHRGLVRMECGRPRLCDQRLCGLVGVGKALAGDGGRRACGRAAPRVDKGDHTDGGQNHRDDDQTGGDDHEWSIRGSGQALTARSNGSLASAMSRWAKRLAAGGRVRRRSQQRAMVRAMGGSRSGITATRVLGTGSGIGMSVVPSPASTSPWTIVKSSPS